MTYASTRWLTVLTILLTCAILVVTPSSVTAQAPGALEILSVEYDANSGLVSIRLRAEGSRDVPVEQLTVLVNAVPRSAVSDERFSPARPSVLLAIDTSGSMAGRPIAAARNAALVFLAQLSEDDPVGLLTFANQPVLQVPVTSHGAQQSAALASLVASGETALHDAIILGLETLAGSPSPRALVLLSDGEESGVSTSTVEDVLAAIDTSNVVIHSFALGTEAPGEFLRNLSNRTDGSFWSVADDEALEELFLALGGRIGASRSAVVRVPGLTVGEHHVTVRARVAGQLAEAIVPFTVHPSVSLNVTPGATPTDGSPITFEVALATTASAHVTVALLGGQGAASLAGTRIFVDPWTVEPGVYSLLVEVHIGGTVVAEQALEVTVPAVAPRLSVARLANGDWRAAGQAQGGSALVAIADGEEIARSEAGTLTFTPPVEAAALTVRLQDARGAAMLDESYNLQAQTGTAKSSPIPILLGIGAAIVFAGGFLAWRRRNTRRAPEVRPLVRKRSGSDTARRPSSLEATTPRAWLQVTQPDGQARQFPLGARPLLAGSTPSADIRLEGPGIRPDHARFSLTPAGDLRIHGVGERGVRPYEAGTDDQWIVVRPGEEVAIAGWLFRLAAADPEQEAI